MLLGLTAFIAGCMVATLLRIISGGKASGKHTVAAGNAESEHRIRALEADLRIAQKNTEELQAKVVSIQQELMLVNEESVVLRKTLERRDTELAEMKKVLTEECKKTVELRKELTGRAEETIRARVQIKNIETELDVAQAGSEVVAEQLQRLTEQREDLTDRLLALGADAVGSDGDQPDSKKSFAGELILDS